MVMIIGRFLRHALTEGFQQALTERPYKFFG